MSEEDYRDPFAYLTKNELIQRLEMIETILENRLSKARNQLQFADTPGSIKNQALGEIKAIEMALKLMREGP